MPIYEYQCSKCGAITEVLQHFSDKPRSSCDQCGGEVNKLISQSTFHLKGSGWYVTDYADKKTTGKKTSTTSKDSTTKKKASDKSTSSA